MPFSDRTIFVHKTLHLMGVQTVLKTCENKSYARTNAPFNHGLPILVTRQINKNELIYRSQWAKQLIQ